MHLGSVLLVGTLFLGIFIPCATAAEAFFVYTDPATGRDVFVNRLEQVPPKLRDRARPVTLDASRVKSEARPKDVALSVAEVGKRVKAIIQNPSQLPRSPEALASEISQNLKAKGHPELKPEEVAAFSRWIFWVAGLALAASFAALVAWVVLLVHAIRRRRPLWAIFMFLFYPIGYVYAFVHVERKRWALRYLSMLALASPLLVGAFAAWRFYAWFQLVLEARTKLG